MEDCSKRTIIILQFVLDWIPSFFIVIHLEIKFLLRCFSYVPNWDNTKL